MGKDKNQQAAEEAAARAAEGVDAHPQLLEHGSFAHLPLGRVAARHDPRTLKLAKYLDDAVVLPEIPADHDWAAAVPSWPMYGNDRLGDCTIAATGHLVQAWTAAAGSPVTPDDALLEQAYIPGTGADDTGRFEVDVLNYWRTEGVAGHKIEAYAYVDPSNLDHVRAAIYLFGGVYAGVALPQTAQGQQVWDVAGDPQAPGPAQAGSWGGHAVPYVAYGGGRFRCVTWAAVLDLTDAFHLAYCDELYAPISLDFLHDGVTPQGFDVAALQADLAEITKQAEAVPLGDFIEHGAYVDAEGVTQVGTPPWADGGGEQAAPSGVVEAIAPDLDDGYYWKG